MDPIRFETGAYFVGKDRQEEALPLPKQGLDRASYAADHPAREGAGAPSSLFFEGDIPPNKHGLFVEELQRRAEKEKLADVTFLSPGASFTALAEKISVETSLPIRVAVRAVSDRWKTLPPFHPLIAAYDLLAFDYCTPKEGEPTDVHTLLTSARSSIDDLASLGVPLKKISLGLAAYGKVFKNVPPGFEGNGYRQKCRGRQLADPNISFAKIEQYRAAHKEAKQFHTSVEGVLQSFLYNPANGDWIGFDDPATVQGKTEWARSYGLKGSFLWGADLDSPEHRELKAALLQNKNKNWTKI